MGGEKKFDVITMEDLEYLREIGLKEHEDFFQRNRHKPYLRKAFYDKLIGICLCQTAASHFLDPKHGFGDFDVWLFYEADPVVNFPDRAYKRTGKPNYKGTYIDCLKKAVDTDTVSEDPGKTIADFLLQRNTESKRYLIEEAVIGLYPSQIFGKVLLPGKTEL